MKDAVETQFAVIDRTSECRIGEVNLTIAANRHVAGRIQLLAFEAVGDRFIVPFLSSRDDACGQSVSQMYRRDCVSYARPCAAFAS